MATTKTSAGAPGRSALTRRRLIVAGGVGLGGVLLAGVGVGLQPTRMRAPRIALRVLDPRAFSVLAAVADRLCPGGDGVPSAWELQVPEAIDLFLTTAHPAVAVELTQGLMLLENGLPGLLLDGRPTPFSARSAEARDATLKRLATSRIGLRRTVYKALVGLVTATYWGDARTFSHTGYRPPTFAPPAVPVEPEPRVERVGDP